MIISTRRTVGSCVGTALIGAALVVPQIGAAKPAAAAKTYTLSLKVKSTRSGATAAKGTFSGKPLGRGTTTSKVAIPKETITLRPTAGGTITLVAIGKVSGTSVKGGWKVTKGTGKYKGGSGKGTFTGNVRSGQFRYTGSLHY
jgi:hypothetical protein